MGGGEWSERDKGQTDGWRIILCLLGCTLYNYFLKYTNRKSLFHRLVASRCKGRVISGECTAKQLISCTAVQRRTWPTGCVSTTPDSEQHVCTNAILRLWTVSHQNLPIPEGLQAVWVFISHSLWWETFVHIGSKSKLNRDRTQVRKDELSWFCVCSLIHCQGHSSCK